MNADSNLQSIAVSATTSGDIVNLQSLSVNSTSYSKSTSGGATETVTLAAAAASSTLQTSQFTYNSFGHVTQSIHPIGRTFTYTYDANNIDLLEITETQGGDNYVLGDWTYNSQHEPTLSIDGSGQQTSTDYNVFGQPTSITDPLSNTTTMTICRHRDRDNRWQRQQWQRVAHNCARLSTFRWL